VRDSERRKWLAWLAARPDRFVDAILHPGDMVPAVASAVGRFWHVIRHPRGFWRSRHTAPRSDPGATSVHRALGGAIRRRAIWRALAVSLAVVVLGMVVRAAMA